MLGTRVHLEPKAQLEPVAQLQPSSKNRGTSGTKGTHEVSEHLEWAQMYTAHYIIYPLPKN